MRYSAILLFFKINQDKIKAIIVVLALFFLVTPFSGDFLYLSRLLLTLKQNWNSISGLDQPGLNHFHPLIISVNTILLQFNYLLEALNPRFFGYDNVFLLRVLLKLPGIILLTILTMVLFKLLSTVQDETSASRFFYLNLLGNFPLLYAVIIQGTNELYLLTLFWIAMGTFIFYIKGDNEKKFLVTSGIFTGILSTFSIIFTLFLLLPYTKLKNEDKLVHLVTYFITFIALNISWNYLFGYNYLNNRTGFNFTLDTKMVFILIVILVFIVIHLIILYVTSNFQLAFLHLSLLFLLVILLFDKKNFLFSFEMFIIALFSLLTKNNINKTIISIIFMFFSGLALFYMVNLYPINSLIYLDLVRTNGMKELIEVVQLVPGEIIFYIAILLSFLVTNFFILKEITRNELN